MYTTERVNGELRRLLFFQYLCIISPMISKYLILMSMTCVKTAGNDPTSPLLRPPSPFQIPLTMITALTIVFQVTVMFLQAGDRFLSSCCRCGLSFWVRNFFPTTNASFFQCCPIHFVMLRLVILHREIYTTIRHSSQPG